jgi:RNA polymerase sigma-70 factor (ECF subfamily)
MREFNTALVISWQEGEESSAQALFTATYPYAVRVGSLSGLTMDEARECAQDTFTRAFERRAQLRDPQAFGLWLHRILTHTILGKLAERSRHRETPLDAVGDIAEDWQRNAPRQPDEAALDAERRDALWRQVQALAPRARLAITLRYYGDLSTREVAETLGVNEGAARTLLSRALGQLRGEQSLETLSDYETSHSMNSVAR